MNSKELDSLTSRIEQYFMQNGGWEQTCYLLGKIMKEKDDEIKRLKEVIEEHRKWESEIVRLQKIEARYNYIKDVLAQMHSPKMNGEHSWRVRPLRTHGVSFDDAVDLAIKEMENENVSCHG